MYVAFQFEAIYWAELQTVDISQWSLWYYLYPQRFEEPYNETFSTTNKLYFSKELQFPTMMK